MLCDHGIISGFACCEKSQRKEGKTPWMIHCLCVKMESHYHLHEISPSFRKRGKAWGRDGEDVKKEGRKMIGIG